MKFFITVTHTVISKIIDISSMITLYFTIYSLQAVKF